ncbi:DEAD/DEAH box helicase [Sphingobacterium yanglingense]|uniref:SWI/SNF-related matrix-associated actin-dependent regulator 1 of chromatin subfamily A n=1 Tax=Sphingobacterium yanglingense TaxID=1437280 RepID=A0A4R6WMH7_9SPHI|nr:DEAD/DEAH box helicase [Sphingobacterium yanglingense]TDQ79545.1 SWI/SNF-related matrix-associated actin-dependent regulator 1 of chromatin subfamily A [Sphingobacterium yanglingense]
MSLGSAITVGNYFKIEFQYKPKIVEAVKALPERKFDFNDKTWSVPTRYRDEVERFCKVHNLQFGQKVVNEVAQNFTIPPLPELTIEIPLKRDPRPYQRTGIAYAIEKQRLFFGDDMGLGKTFQAIAAIEALHQQGKAAYPCLIVCPSAVKENWVKEVLETVNRKAVVMVDGMKNTYQEFYRTGLAQFFIVNYESLKKYFVEAIDDPGFDEKTGKKKKATLKHYHFRKKAIDFYKSIIFDESHKLKAVSTQASKISKGIAVGKETIFLLTGTPLINKPNDLIAQLGIMNRLVEMGGYKHFIDHFCSGPKGASNLKELNFQLNKNCFFRRNKTDPEVKKYLPDKSRQVILCDLSKEARKEYSHAMANLESYMKQYKDASDEKIQQSMKGEVMVRIGILKNISARGKLKDAFSFIQELVEQGQKVVVFCNLTEIVHAVQKEFVRSVRLTGAENAVQKQASVDAFRTEPNIDVIVLNLKAGGVGVNGLQDVSTNVCFIEFGWHAAIMDQAEDRLYRMGQHNNVMCTYFLGRDTIDEWNYDLIQKKREIANTVTGTEDMTEVSIVDSFANLFNNK